MNGRACCGVGIRYVCGEPDVPTERKAAVLQEAMQHVVDWFAKAVRLRWTLMEALKLAGRATCGHDGGS
eukprot:scaffold2874_cov384-Prasinococcus_capsulatus_cf.AAC.6